MSLTVAIVGRPNVGKSTLFNRLVGKRLALVDDRPGVTRDRREGLGRIGPLGFTVIDTAGYDDASGTQIEVRMRQQTERALAEADVVLLLIDARAGLTPLDRHFADVLRRNPKPVVVIANKCEGRAGEAGRVEAFELGLGEPLPFSAEHGEGMNLLYDALAPYADEPVDADETTTSGAEPPLQLAIIGRPNVGKSTLVNRLIGDERVLTGPEPGITRDAISVSWTFQGRQVRLIDTAGLRRRARVSERLEGLANADTMRAIRYAHIAVIVLDATAALEKQDLTIARMIVDEGRVPVIALNKWDLVTNPKETRRDVEHKLELSLPQIRGVKIIACSALTGRGVERLLPAAIAAYLIWDRRIPTGALNRWLDETTARHPPPMAQGRPVKLRYMTQVKARPPTFVVFSNRPQELPDSYTRYLINGLREAFALAGVPIRVVLRKGKNPYHSGS